jgi:hypothetical protein
MSNPIHPPYQRPAQEAIAGLPAAVRASWRSKYLSDPAAELRVTALIKSAEAHLVGTGQTAAIRALWLLLADRVGLDPSDPDMRAAAALTGLAMGLGGADDAAEVAL